MCIRDSITSTHDDGALQLQFFPAADVHGNISVVCAKASKRTGLREVHVFGAAVVHVPVIAVSDDPHLTVGNRRTVNQRREPFTMSFSRDLLDHVFTVDGFTVERTENLRIQALIQFYNADSATPPTLEIKLDSGEYLPLSANDDGEIVVDSTEIDNLFITTARDTLDAFEFRVRLRSLVDE